MRTPSARCWPRSGASTPTTITEAVRLYGEDTGRPDELTLARIEREREEASQRLAKTRDIAAWQATMARLDAEAEVARQPREGRRLAIGGGRLPALATVALSGRGS